MGYAYTPVTVSNVLRVCQRGYFGSDGIRWRSVTHGTGAKGISAFSVETGKFVSFRKPRP